MLGRVSPGPVRESRHSLNPIGPHSRSRLQSIADSRKPEERLTEGYARAHELERQAIQLERQSTGMLARGATPEQVHEVLQKHRAVERDLVALRRRLSLLREELGPTASYIGPPA